MPTAHAVHTAAEGAPASAPYAPKPHAAQAEVPVERSLYAPAAQPVHTPTVFAAVTSPYAPATHAVHTDDWVAAGTPLYHPEGHAVQPAAGASAL